MTPAAAQPLAPVTEVTVTISTAIASLPAR
jgi:hypothetical protein